MKPKTSYQINDRSFTAFRPLPEELALPENTPILFDLPNPGLLKVANAPARQFLQGQLSCDVEAVTAEQMCPGALCNLQGRILNLVDVIDWQGLHLVMPNDLLALTQSNLSKAALLSRVTLTPNETLESLGLYCPNLQQLPSLPIPLPSKLWQTQQTEHSYSYAISEQLVILLLPAAIKQTILALFTPEHIYGSLAWHALELQHQRLSIYPNTRGLFLPHRLGLHETPYLNFQKGCYKGQEIIARTHYRAKLKHALYRYQITTTEPIHAGQKLWDTTHQSEIGELVDYCPLDNHRFLILISALFEHPRQVRLEKHQALVRLEAGLPH